MSYISNGEILEILPGGPAEVNFPRYGIVVKIGLPYLLFGDAVKKDVLLAAEALSVSCGVSLTDQGENYFKYERKWKAT